MSRRQTWNVIKENKKGRIILLTTHFLDEADFLSDRIVIMSSGTAYCAGTPLFLKNRLSHGYQLAFSHDNVKLVEDLVSSIIPQAVKSDDIQRHINKMYLPVSAMSKFGDLLDALESLKPPLTEVMLSPPLLEDVFLTVANNCHGSFNKSSTDNLAGMLGTSKGNGFGASTNALLADAQFLQVPAATFSIGAGSGKSRSGSSSSRNASNHTSGRSSPVLQGKVCCYLKSFFK